MAPDIARGLAGLDRMVSEHGIVGVHGRLVDLIDCAPQLNTAVEVTAGMDTSVGTGGSTVICPFLLPPACHTMHVSPRLPPSAILFRNAPPPPPSLSPSLLQATSFSTW